MFAHARDEAHRASNALRIKVFKRRRLRSQLDDIDGVGPKTRKLLLKAFGDMQSVAAAEVEALVAAGTTRRQAENIHAHFHGGDAEADASEDSAVDNAFVESG